MTSRSDGRGSVLDSEHLLNKKYYPAVIDFIERLGSIEGFLALAEHTLDWQLRGERLRVTNSDAREFPIPADYDADSYRRAQLEATAGRFNALAQHLRHTALIAFTSAVEITVIRLREDTEAVFAQVKSKNDATYIITAFNERFSLSEEKLILDFRHLVTVRNFLVHGQRDRKHPLDKAVCALGPSFRIADDLFFRSETVSIERCGLEPHVLRMKPFIEKLWEMCDVNGLF